MFEHKKCQTSGIDRDVQICTNNNMKKKPARRPAAKKQKRKVGSNVFHRFTTLVLILVTLLVLALFAQNDQSNVLGISNGSYLSKLFDLIPF